MALADSTRASATRPWRRRTLAKLAWQRASCGGISLSLDHAEGRLLLGGGLVSPQQRDLDQVVARGPDHAPVSEREELVDRLPLDALALLELAVPRQRQT